MKINVLMGNLGYFNTKALVFPLVRYSKSLRDLGISVSLYKTIEDSLTDCDVLILDSKKFRGQWKNKSSEALDQVGNLASGAARTFWFNTGDSTGGIQKQVIDLVDVYCKNQLLKDRSLYQKPFYGGRIFSDYYHQKYQVCDSEPEHSAVLSGSQIKKLRISWNLGLNPNLLWVDHVRGRFSSYPSLLKWTSHPVERLHRASLDQKKSLFVNCMFNVDYDRSSVGFQRQALAKVLLDLDIGVKRSGRRQYYSLLAKSRYVLSPFGWGEICIRDFEALLAGAILIKPDMSHVETWPNIYLSDETYIPHSWDLDEFRAQMSELLKAQRADCCSRVQAARRLYQEQIGAERGHGFAQYFSKLLVS